MTLADENAKTVAEQNAATTQMRQRLMQIRLASRSLSVPRRSVSRRLVFTAAPHAVYETLLDGDRLSALTGAAIRVDPQVGGDVAFGDGSAAGVIMELLEDRHIAVAWRPAQIPWPEKLYSTATFMLKPEGAGTQLTFFQQDVPADAHDAVAQWWQEHYWQGLEAALG